MGTQGSNQILVYDMGKVWSVIDRQMEKVDYIIILHLHMSRQTDGQTYRQMEKFHYIIILHLHMNRQMDR